MEKEVFKFHVQSLSFGWCRVLMLINDKRITYNASYIRANPLTSLIDACADLMDEGGLNYIYGDGRCYVVWEAEPGNLSIEMVLDKEKMLHLNIVDDHDSEDNKEEWNETVPFDAFVSAIVSESYRVLNAFGLWGYRRSWQNEEDFPLANLLRISGECQEMMKGDSFTTDITKELGVLQNNISKIVITEETKLGEGTIYYESWQIQCCGDPFSVGDMVDWTCIMPSGYKNAHGIIIDFEENHHGFASHSISGTVTKIIVERSEFPKGKREAWYDKACVIHEEIQHANGWESDYKDDDTTERTFWGYIVELKDVTVKPLK